MSDCGGSRAPRGFAAGPVGTNLPQVPRRRPGVISSSCCAGPHRGGGGRLRPWRGRRVQRGTKVCAGTERCPWLWRPRAVGFDRCSPLAPGSPLGFGCPVCSAAASAAEQVGKAGGEQPRAGRVATKASPLRPNREKGVKKLKGYEISAKRFILKIPVMLKCFRM